MTKTEKDFFGKGFNVKAEVTNGRCPVCESPTVFVSIYKNFYRCMHCGGDTEQKVNGVISYIPAVVAGGRLPILTRIPDISEDNG
tara:strand:- start:275 stop:529 length:255 start_codon:yes stop_codon:yes gene_type:complete